MAAKRRMGAPPDLPEEALVDEFEFRAAIAAQVGCEARSSEAAEFCTGENCAFIEAAQALQAAAPAIRKQERERVREDLRDPLAQAIHERHGGLPWSDLGDRERHGYRREAEEALAALDQEASDG
jgi:hypothetical protein